MASNIKVVLELENRKYLQDIKRAETAGTQFGKNTKRAVDDSSKAFDRLKGAVAAIGLSALVKSSVNLASQLNNMSAATGIAIDKLGGFRSALIAAGGSGERAIDAISDLTKNMGEAANGSKELQDSFFKVGVSMEDIQSLSKEDLFKKTLEGLSAMPDKAQRTALAFKLMGESVKGVDINQLNRDMGNFGGNTSAIQAAAAAQTALSTNFDKLQIALLNVLEPLNKLVAALDISIGVFEALIKIILAVAGAYLLFGKGIATVTGLANTAISGLRAQGGAMALLSGHAKALYKDLSAIPSMWIRVATGAKNAASGYGAMIGTMAMLGRSILRFAGFAGLIYSVADALNELSKWAFNVDVFAKATSAVGKLVDKFKELTGLGTPGDKTGQTVGRNAQLQLEAYRKMEEAAKAKAAAEAEAAKKLAQYRAEAVRQITSETNALGNQLSFAKGRLQLQNDYLEAQQKGVTLGNVSLAILEQQQAIEQERSNALEQLYNKQEELKSSLKAIADITSEEYKQKQIQLELLTGQIADTNKLYSTHKDGMAKLLQDSENLQIIDQARLTLMEAQVKAAEDSIARQETLADLLNKSNSKLSDVKFEGTLINLTPFEQQLEQIKQSSRNAAIEAGKAFSQMFPEDITPEQGYELAEGLKAIADAHKKIADAEIANLEAARNWKTLEEARLTLMEAQAKAAEDNIARQQALADILSKSSMDLGTVKFEGSQAGLGSLEKQFNQIKESARLAAYEAGKAFSQMFPEDITPEQGYELAEGLKAIAEAHKKIAEAQIANIETSRLWSTGMQESMADFISASENAADQARGYFEKFTTGVEDAFVNFVQTGKLSFKDLANTMIAEFARVQAKKLLAGLMGGGGGGGGSFLGSLFGGFFADGGTLGAGKWGIAGENGPEIIKGPAQVVNAQQMAGAAAATNITYNIQAVDAASFKSMVARDPEFIYSVTEQGRRGMPGRRSR